MKSVNHQVEASSGSLFSDCDGEISVSFEFFPPASDETSPQLWQTVEALRPCSPGFVSVTYGAGGSTRERSFDLVEKLVRDSNLPVAAHLTCVGASRGETDDIALRFHAMGVRRIVALRGDGGKPGTPFTPHPDGYCNAAELVEGLKKLADFDISVAAYPEVHPDAKSAETDLDNLKRKFDAGANRALTQFFFSPDSFFRFRDRALAAGIDQPIIPGVLPVTNYAQTRKFAAACGANVPNWMECLFDGLDDFPAPRQMIAAALAAEFCGQLHAGGVRNFHFYTLNRPEITQAICQLVGRRLTASGRNAA